MIPLTRSPFLFILKHSMPLEILSLSGILLLAILKTINYGAKKIEKFNTLGEKPEESNYDMIKNSNLTIISKKRKGLLDRDYKYIK